MALPNATLAPGQRHGGRAATGRRQGGCWAASASSCLRHNSLASSRLVLALCVDARHDGQAFVGACIAQRSVERGSVPWPSFRRQPSTSSCWPALVLYGLIWYATRSLSRLAQDPGRGCRRSGPRRSGRCSTCRSADRRQRRRTRGVRGRASEPISGVAAKRLGRRRAYVSASAAAAARSASRRHRREAGPPPKSAEPRRPDGGRAARRRRRAADRLGRGAGVLRHRPRRARTSPSASPTAPTARAGWSSAARW